MSMRTPLSKVRGIGSAKDGTQHFWHQRLTAVALVPLVLFLVWQLVLLVGAPYQVVIEHLSSPIVAVAFLLLMVSGIYHMKLGMQVVIEDYVHVETTKIAMLIASLFFSLAIGAISVFSILKISFGA